MIYILFTFAYCLTETVMTQIKKKELLILTTSGSRSSPSGKVAPFILAIQLSVDMAPCMFPAETWNRADSGIN